MTAHAYLFYPDASELTRGGAGATRHARRPHRARRGVPDRDARPRDSRRRRPARCRAVGPRRRARLRALRRDAERGGRRALGPGARGPCGPSASTLASTPTSRRRTSRRGAQDRSPPADRARRARRRAARAPGRDGGPLRAAARPGREPLPRSRRRSSHSRASAPTTSSSAAGGRPSARSRSAAAEPSALRGIAPDPPSIPLRARKWRFAQRAWTGRSAPPLLSLPRAGLPEHVQSERPRAPNHLRTSP